MIVSVYRATQLIDAEVDFAGVTTLLGSAVTDSSNDPMFLVRRDGGRLLISFREDRIMLILVKDRDEYATTHDAVCVDSPVRFQGLCAERHASQASFIDPLLAMDELRAFFADHSRVGRWRAELPDPDMLEFPTSLIVSKKVDWPVTIEVPPDLQRDMKRVCTKLRLASERRWPVGTVLGGGSLRGQRDDWHRDVFHFHFLFAEGRMWRFDARLEEMDAISNRHQLWINATEYDLLIDTRELTIFHQHDTAATLHALPPCSRVQFGAACARHAIQPFTEMTADQYTPSLPDIMDRFQELIEQIWTDTSSTGEEGIGLRHRRSLSELVGVDFGDDAAVSELKLEDAVEWLVRCLDSGEPDAALLVARSAFLAVEEWEESRNDSRIRTAEERRSFALGNPAYRRELEFQANCLIAIAKDDRPDSLGEFCSWCETAS